MSCITVRKNVLFQIEIVHCNKVKQTREYTTTPPPIEYIQGVMVKANQICCFEIFVCM